MAVSDGGKGSSPRPFSVSNEEYAQRWNMIFGRDKQVIPTEVDLAEQYLELEQQKRNNDAKQ